MHVLLAGGSGFIGRAVIADLLESGHQVSVLTRAPAAARLPSACRLLEWDGRTVSGWAESLSQVQAVINLSGESLARWPWTGRQKQRFLDSRVQAGRALVEAIRAASPRPRLLIQSSGINHYGLQGGVADESTLPGDDFLARLTVNWEAATREVEDLGVRRCVLRTALVLGQGGGLLSLMTLPVRLFAGGPLGSGRQAVAWVHLQDVTGVVRFLLEDAQAIGVYNLVAPDTISNAEFYRLLARVLKRPYWLPVPAFALRLLLGEMAVLVVDGRPAWPTHLLAAGYRFKFPQAESALRDLVP